MDLSSPFAALLAKFNRYDGVLNAAANESAPRDTGIEILGIDPRAHTKEKLAAPAPLPHLSRGSLRRVKHRLPAPTTCPYCKEDTVELVRNSEIYSRGSAGSKCDPRGPASSSPARRPDWLAGEWSAGKIAFQFSPHLREDTYTQSVLVYLDRKAHSSVRVSIPITRSASSARARVRC